jgi:Protein of unknown function (DUF2946)
MTAGMNWFRKHVKSGSRLALLALAIQFALSFGHFHHEAARAAPATEAVTAGVVLVANTTAPAEQAQPEAAQQPSDHDSARHVIDCAICAVLSLAHHSLLATPPLLDLPRAVELLRHAVGAEFAHLDTFRTAFRSRAPPVS